MTYFLLFTGYQYIDLKSTSSGKSLGINLISARSTDLSLALAIRFVQVQAQRNSADRSDPNSSFCNKLSNFYWKVRWTSGIVLSPGLFSRVPVAPLSHRSRGSARPQKENEFFRRSFFRATRRSSLAARELPVEIFLARTSRTLSAHVHFSTLSSASRGDPERSAAAPSAADLMSRSLVYQRGSARDVSRPVINKSIALLSHKAARSTCGTFITERGGEPGERARGDWGRWSEEGRGEVLSTVQNREERPATRNKAVRSPLRSWAQQEANDFSCWKPGRVGRIVVQRTPRHVVLLSFSLPADLCANLFTITSILQCRACWRYADRRARYVS